MKIRQAKKIMKRCYGSPRYIRMILDGLNVSKKLPKIKQYWEPRWALYYASKGGGYGRVDHRIIKAMILAERWNARRYRNEAAKFNKKNPLSPRDLRRSVERLKQYSV